MSQNPNNSISMVLIDRICERQQMKFGGVIIAGGKGTRMGGQEKLLLPLGGKPILERILHRAGSQVDAIAIDVRSSSQSRYDAWRTRGIPILTDPFGGEVGPLGGVVAGLNWLATLGDEFAWLATFPGDAPFLPRNLVATLKSFIAADCPRPVVAVDHQRVQSLCALWPASCASSLCQGVRDSRFRSVKIMLEELGAVRCPFDAGSSFLNINTERDLIEAERLITDHLPQETEETQCSGSP